MRKKIAIIVAASIALASCGSPQYLGPKDDQKYYPTYGIFNEASSKSVNVCYNISVGNVVWSIIMIETLFMPIYFIGFSLYNPIRLKKSPTDTCGFDS